MEITHITPDLVGKKVTCTINQTTKTSGSNIGEHIILDGEIAGGPGKYYILQNIADGTKPEPKLMNGYKFGWTLNGATVHDLVHFRVTNLRLNQNNVHELW